MRVRLMIIHSSHLYSVHIIFGDNILLQFMQVLWRYYDRVWSGIIKNVWNGKIKREIFGQGYFLNSKTFYDSDIVFCFSF